jgi:hypothetical protein
MGYIAYIVQSNKNWNGLEKKKHEEFLYIQLINFQILKSSDDGVQHTDLLGF